MKSVIYTALLLASSTSWGSLPKFSLQCTNPQNETLSIQEFSTTKFPIKNPFSDKKYVFATYSDAQGKQSFQGTAIAPGFIYEMNPTVDGLAVSLDVELDFKFNHTCGRCPFPVDPVEPKGQTYFAKLTVGSEVHDFVCKQH